MNKLLPPPGRLLIPVLACCLPLTVAVAAPVAASTYKVFVPKHRAHPAAPITGRVTDEKGEGLPGVTVRVKNGNQGTTTDVNGNFSLDAPADATLIISSVGYTTKEIAINNQTTINTSLAADTQQLSEAVVVGYVVQQRQDVTGSVASVGGADVRRSPVATLSESIEGRVPGVQVTTNGTPGQTPNINIRGVGSINNGSGPLFIIDGLWVTGGLRDFTPQDVESVQVLKDAAALAPYGVSGANGVVIITTKKGRSGTTNINFNAYAGVQNIGKRYDLANAAQYTALATQAYTNAGLRVPSGIATPSGVDTDWQKEFFKTGVIQDYNLGFSGGGPNSNYLISGDYFSQSGTVIGPKYERYNLRVNSGFTKGKLKVGENLALTRANQTRLNGTPFIDLLRITPITPVYDPANPGGFGYGDSNNRPTFGSNPIGAQRLLNNIGANNQLQGNVFGEFSFSPSLRYRLNLGTQYRGFHDQRQQQAGGLAPNNITPISGYTDAQGNETFLLAENTLTFDHSFGLHNLTVVGGYSEQRDNFEFTQGAAQGYGNGPTFYWALDAGASPLPGTGSTYVWAKRSYFGQLTYDYDGRYLVTGAFRRDGSSRFSADRKYGNFGAGSLGWRVSKEKFFEGITAINDFKLRASYGILGSDQLNGAYGGSYLYQAFINPNVNYNFGGAIANGAIQTALGSPSVGWEERRTQNYGLDMGFLDNHLTLSADYYISETRNANVNPQIPLFLGNAGGDPFQQIGRIQNKGFELLVGWNDTKGKLTYGATANLTTISNKVMELGSSGAQANFFDAGPNGGVTRTAVGYEVGSFYLYQFDGIFQTGDNIATSAQPTAQPGDVRYRDANGDGKIDANDRVHVGRVFPKLQYGLNLTAGYGGFDLAVFFQGVQGNDVYNSGAYWLGRFDDPTNYQANLSPWTPTNPSTTTPRLALASGTNTLGYTTRFLENGSYLRLKNLQIGYTIPKTALGGGKVISSARLYLTSQNLFTITKYSGYDPETIGGLDGSLLTRGVDEGNYPNPRTFTLGVQLGF
ncbi:MAG: SusC/RagA family TonB-linked outer membrane protein [Janthinobacterium lividum]|jgi:TonB-linked SusC/RagA family outer membrane protein